MKYTRGASVFFSRASGAAIFRPRTVGQSAGQSVLSFCGFGGMFFFVCALHAALL